MKWTDWFRINMRNIRDVFCLEPSLAERMHCRCECSGEGLRGLCSPVQVTGGANREKVSRAHRLCGGRSAHGHMGFLQRSGALSGEGSGRGTSQPGVRFTPGTVTDLGFAASRTLRYLSWATWPGHHTGSLRKGASTVGLEPWPCMWISVSLHLWPHRLIWLEVLVPWSRVLAAVLGALERWAQWNPSAR